MKNMLKSTLESPELVLLAALGLYIIVGMAAYNAPETLQFSVAQIFGTF